MTITADQLKAILPHIKDSDLQTYLPLLQQLLPAWHIDTAQRVGGFLAQTGEESISFSATRELGTGHEYEGRKDLGNSQPGDGPKFKGRGLIQITGRNNYEWCSKDVYGDENKLLENPELLEEPEAAVNSACWFWTVVKPLNKICDYSENWTTVFKKKTYTKIAWLTLLVNGGENGLDVRTANYQRARKALGY